MGSKQNKTTGFANRPHVCAVIVTWNKKAYVLRLLEALSFLDYPSDKFEIVVVDNASTDGTAGEIERRFPHVQLLQNRQNLGGSGGFNRGMRWALGNRPAADYLWLLDNDVLVPPAALAHLVEVLESHADAAVCGATLLNQDNPAEVLELGAFIDYRRGDIRRNLTPARNRGAKDGIDDVDYVAACSLLVKTDAARKVGLWHESLFIYWDDMEWGARFKAQGYRVLASHRAVAYHPSWVGRTADSSAVWRNYYRSRNGLCFFNHYSRGLMRRLLLGRMVLRFNLLAVHTALRSEAALSAAFSEAVDDFFRGRYGKKDLAMPATDLARCLRTHDARSLCAFLPYGHIPEKAGPFIRALAHGQNGLALHLIVRDALAPQWRREVPEAEIFAFRTHETGAIPLTEKWKVRAYIRNKARPVVFTPPLAARFLALAGVSIARVDFERGEVIAVERLRRDTLTLAPVRTMRDLFRAVVAPPPLVWEPPASAGRRLR